MTSSIPSKILVIFFLLTSVSYADISNITIDDTRDHQKISKTMNQIIDHINADNKAARQEVSVVKSNSTITATQLSDMRTKLSSIRKDVGDPSGTVSDVKTKFILLMDALEKSTIPQHAVVTP